MTFHDTWRENRSKPLLESPRPKSPLLLEINQAVVDYVWDNFNIQNAALNKFFGGKLRIVEDLDVKAPSTKLKKLQSWIQILTDYSPDLENPDMLLITYHNEYSKKDEQKRVKIGKYLQKLANLSKKIDKYQRAGADIIEKSKLYHDVAAHMRAKYGDKPDTEKMITRMSMPVFARMLRWIDLGTLKTADPQEITARMRARGPHAAGPRAKATSPEATDEKLSFDFNKSTHEADSARVLFSYINSYLTKREPELYNELLPVIVKMAELYLTAAKPGLAATQAFRTSLNSYSIYSDEVEQINDLITSGTRSSLRQAETYIKQWPEIKKEMNSEYLKLVISRHPIDVVRMSDFKHIQSCHSQGSSYFSCALAEAQGHGLVAYAITSTQYEQIADRLTTSEEIFNDKQRKVADGVEPLFRLRGRQIQFDFSILEFDFPDIDAEVWEKLDDNDARGSFIVPEIRFYGVDRNTKAALVAKQQMTKILHTAQQDAIKTLKTGFQFLKDNGIHLSDLNQVFSLSGGLEDSNTAEILQSFFPRGSHEAKDIPPGGLGSQTDQPNPNKLGLTQQFEFRASVEHILKGLVKTSPVEIMPEGYGKRWAERRIVDASLDAYGTYQLNIKIPNVSTDESVVVKIVQIFARWSTAFNKTCQEALEQLKVDTKIDVDFGQNRLPTRRVVYDDQHNMYTLRLNIYSGFGRYEDKRNPTDEAVEHAVEITAQLMNAMVDDISNIVEEIQLKFN